MANEVTIIIKAKNETKAAFTAARKDAEKLGTDLGSIVGQHISNSVNTSAGAAAQYEQAGNKIGDVIGRRIRDRISENIKVAFEKIKIDRSKISVEINEDDKEHGSQSGGTNDKNKDKNVIKVKVDVDESSRKSVLEKFKDLASQLGSNLKDKLGSGFAAAFSGDIISTVVKGVVASFVVGLAAPVIGAAVVASILLALGGGVLGLGIAGAFKDPRIQGAAKDLGKKLETIFEKFGEPFRGPLANFLEKFGDFLDDSAPQFKTIADTFAPVLDSLGTGLISAMQNALPGVTDAIIAAAPFFETLAKHLPDIGQRIGDFFRDIGEHGPEANVFFSDLLTVIEKLIGFLGRLIGAMASGYSKLRSIAKTIGRIFSSMKTGAKSTGELITNKFKSAGEKVIGAYYTVKEKVLGVFVSIANSADSMATTVGNIIGRIKNALTSIPRSISINIRGIASGLGGLAGSILGNAHGGIVGAATGGIHSGLRLVGEAGPELAELPPGTRVHPTGATQRMLNGQGGGAPQGIELSFRSGAEHPLIQAIVKALRYEITHSGSGNVQQFLGSRYA